MQNRNPVGRLGLVGLQGLFGSLRLFGLMGMFGLMGFGASRSLADGPADNQVASIRPVPPPGIEVPAEVRESLSKSLEVL